MTEEELAAEVAKRYGASMRRSVVHGPPGGFYARILVIGEHVLLAIPMPGPGKAAEELADDLNSNRLLGGVRVEPRPRAQATAVELAWGIIANAGGGDWERETPEWRDAAARWRDEFVGGVERTGRTP
jgi:hypothetical protein